MGKYICITILEHAQHMFDKNSKYWYSSSFLSFFDLEYLNLILVKPFYYILLNFIDF